MKEITLEATLENLQIVQDLISEELEKADCPMKTQIAITIAVEEIFVNIASYAYGDSIGKVTVSVEIQNPITQAVITFIDQGVPYNPLAKEDPDITLSAEERSIGGLGIFMVKKSMDDVIYEYRNNSNILTIKKIF